MNNEQLKQCIASLLNENVTAVHDSSNRYKFTIQGSERVWSISKKVVNNHLVRVG
jgi:hypothetical protein